MLHNTDRFWFYIFQDETQEMIALFLSYHYIFIIYWCCVFHDKFDAQPSCSTTWDLAHKIHATSHLLQDLCRKTMTLMMGMMMMAMTMARIAMTVLMMATTMTRCQGWRWPRCFWAEDMFPFSDLACHLTHWPTTTDCLAIPTTSVNSWEQDVYFCTIFAHLGMFWSDLWMQNHCVSK